MFAPALPAPAAPPSDEPADDPSAGVTGGAPPRRPRGPVLIADLLMAPNGRPLLLAHWDRDAEGACRR
jgi:hypothetical protein